MFCKCGLCYERVISTKHALAGIHLSEQKRTFMKNQIAALHNSDLSPPADTHFQNYLRVADE